MDNAEHIEAAAGELEAIVATLRAGPLSPAVPTCPGWTLADLASHVGEFCGFWAHVLCEGTGRDKTPFGPVPDGDADRVDWLAAAGADLVDQLRRTPPETAVWTWYEPDRTAGFVARRSANELAVHRFDAESARGTPRPIPVALAVDGIDEVLTRLVVVRERSGQAAGETLHVHGTDEAPADGRPAEWLVTLHADRIETERRHAKGDLALRGAASDLELLLLGRDPLGPVEQLGDPAVLDAWRREFVF